MKVISSGSTGMISLVLAGLFVLSFSPASSGAMQWPGINLVEAESGLQQPTDITNAGDGSGRMFIAERQGVVLIYRDGQMEAQPFLDISDRVNTDGSEEGLLSLGFPPDYSGKGYFYVYYTDADSNNVISRFHLSGDPDQADAASEEVILTIEHPDRTNHNGGKLLFGPDGYLYLGTGDGGGGGDPGENAQDPSSLLGKILRLDVESGGGYVIPADNPFVGQAGYGQEIWALGLRNPWRMSFDRTTGGLYIADVGQDTWEEINYQAPSSGGGENYGWDNLEGTHCYEPSTGCAEPENYVPPVFEYGHDMGQSITGGMVYRGSGHPEAVGIYFFGDFVTGTIWGLKKDAGRWKHAVLERTFLFISTFGEDEDGELYLADYYGGLYRMDFYAFAGPGINDYDGDHHSDLLWYNGGSGEVYLALMDGSTTAGEAAITTLSDLDWQPAGTADFDGDGKTDILWKHGLYGWVYLWLMDGYDIDGLDFVSTLADLSWEVAGTGDFDGDGTADILWRHGTTGWVYLWLMDGSTIGGHGVVSILADLSWQVAGTGDFDGDGKTDVLWRHDESGLIYLWLMNGYTITDHGVVAPVSDLSWQITGVGDFSGDGRCDILWSHGDSGQVFVWAMDGLEVNYFGYVASITDPAWLIIGLGDHDADGRIDMVWSNNESGAVYIWFMDGSTVWKFGYVGASEGEGWELVN